MSRTRIATMLAGVIALIVFSIVAYPVAQTFYDSIAWRATGKLLLSSTAPTISSGFGSTPAILSHNGAATFRVNVGTGGSATSGVVGMPTATTGWNCRVEPISNEDVGGRTRETASTTTTVTVQSFSPTTPGAPFSWPASTTLLFNCEAF